MTERRAAVDGETATGLGRFSRRALVAFVAALVAAVAFVVVLALVASSFSGLIDLDRSTANRFHRFAVAHAAFTQAMKLVSDAGTSIAWWIILGLAACWLAYRRLPRLVAFVLVAGIGSSLLNNLIKLLVGRARPKLSDPVAIAAGKSFPSGHAQAAIVGYGILLVVFLPAIPPRWRRPVAALAAVMVLLIGFSRIALGVHYLSDVIGAYLIGFVWLLGMIAVFRAWRREAGKADRGTLDALERGLEPEQADRLDPGL
jgi:undecaprenyl-diphosphatase